MATFGILSWHDYRHNISLFGKDKCDLCGLKLK